MWWRLVGHSSSTCLWRCAGKCSNFINIILYLLTRVITTIRTAPLELINDHFMFSSSFVLDSVTPIMVAKLGQLIRLPLSVQRWVRWKNPISQHKLCTASRLGCSGPQPNFVIFRYANALAVSRHAEASVDRPMGVGRRLFWWGQWSPPIGSGKGSSRCYYHYIICQLLWVSDCVRQSIGYRHDRLPSM